MLTGDHVDFLNQAISGSLNDLFRSDSRGTADDAIIKPSANALDFSDMNEVAEDDGKSMPALVLPDFDDSPAVFVPLRRKPVDKSVDHVAQVFPSFKKGEMPRFTDLFTPKLKRRKVFRAIRNGFSWLFS